MTTSLDQTHPIFSSPEGIKSDIRDTVSNLRNAATMAKKRGNVALLDKIKELAGEVVKYLWKFAKIAFSIAVHKFVIEMAAQIMQTVMNSLLTAFNGKKDVVLSADISSFTGGSPFSQPQVNTAQPGGFNNTGRSLFGTGAPAFTAY